MTTRLFLGILGMALGAGFVCHALADDKVAARPPLPLPALFAVLAPDQAGPAIEAPINLYLHCDDREDNFLEQTDEIYLIGSYAGPDGKAHPITAGPHDFRDGGDRERWRDFHRLGVCNLKPGEQMTGTIKVMEDDGSSGKIIAAVKTLVDIALAGNESPEAQIAKVVAKVFSLVSKGDDDEIITVNYTVTNVDGRLVTRAWSNSPGVTDEGAKVINVHGQPVTFCAFRAKNGFNYHLRIWAGPNRDNH